LIWTCNLFTPQRRVTSSLAGPVNGPNAAFLAIRTRSRRARSRNASSRHLQEFHKPLFGWWHSRVRQQRTDGRQTVGRMRTRICYGYLISIGVDHEVGVVSDDNNLALEKCPGRLLRAAWSTASLRSRLLHLRRLAVERYSPDIRTTPGYARPNRRLLGPRWLAKKALSRGTGATILAQVRY
jgi:hypothetical protein